MKGSIVKVTAPCEVIMKFPETLGAGKQDPHWKQKFSRYESVRDEIRRNLLNKLREGVPLFPGIHGYDDTVIPALVDALLARHNIILLGLRGQAKSRIIRQLIQFLDEWVPTIEGCEIHDHPVRPICARCRKLVHEAGDELPLTFIHREERFVEKLATPDVTVADLIGDIDPIRAVREGQTLSSESIIHFGLVPRAHRGIFALNELPDLSPKVQVALFNIMQEGDIQIKGFPVRLRVDVLLVFTANPEDYTARGKIISPLKDRIGSEIRTHYPHDREVGKRITKQEAWWQRSPDQPVYINEIVFDCIEEIARVAREDPHVDQRSGVSQRLPITLLEVVISRAEQRAVRLSEPYVAPRLSDLFSSFHALTGKLELEYEGEVRGAEWVAQSIVREAMGRLFKEYFRVEECLPVAQWFARGGQLILPEWETTTKILNTLERVPGLIEQARRFVQNGIPEEVSLIVGAELILNGLWAHRYITRHPERGYIRAEARQPEYSDEGDPFSPLFQ